MSFFKDLVSSRHVRTSLKSCSEKFRGFNAGKLYYGFHTQSRLALIVFYVEIVQLLALYVYFSFTHAVFSSKICCTEAIVKSVQCPLFVLRWKSKEYFLSTKMSINVMY